jgi:hypothetical protein
MRSFLVVSLSTLALAATARAGAADIRVGADASCTTHTIADALAMAKATPDVDTIRLVDDQPYENQTVYVDTSVNLVGGHASCSATAPAGRTHLVGNGRWATLAVVGDGLRVRLEHLDVSGGGTSGEIGLWGGLHVEGSVQVALADVEIHDNENVNGGGLEISGQAIVELEHDVDVHDNSATLGGGVLVSNATLRVRPHGVAIRDNVAYGGGGGLALTFGGQMSVGTNPEAEPRPVDGVLIAGNQALGYGGGVFVHGDGAMLLADDTVVRDNLAAEGGGVYAGDGGYAQFARFRDGPFRHCPNELECLRLSGNRAERGGALAVRDGATAHLDQAIVRGNVAAAGAAFHMHGDASRMRLYASLVVGNACAEDAPAECAPIQTFGGALRFEHSTFADNGGGEALIWGDGVEHAVVTDIQGYSSLIAGKEKIFGFIGAIPTVHYDCVLKDRGVAEIAATRSDVQPFTFQDPARGDYHLPGDSVAMDWCDGTPVSSQSPDMDGTRRGIDAGRGDVFGPYDLGAFESDRIFASGTELRR